MDNSAGDDRARSAICAPRTRRRERGFQRQHGAGMAYQYCARWLDLQQHDGGATPDNFLNVLHDALIKNSRDELYDHVALAERYEFAEDALSATLWLRPGTSSSTMMPRSHRTTSNPTTAPGPRCRTTAPMVWEYPTTTPSASTSRSRSSIRAEGVPDWRYEPPVRPVGNAIAAVRPPIGAKMPIFCCLVATAPAPQTFAVPIIDGKLAAPSGTGTGWQGVLVAVALHLDK